MANFSKVFEAEIELIGINPFIFVPDDVLDFLFKAAQKDKGRIPVRIKIDGFEFSQTLVKYSKYWRLYLNQPMRTAAKKEVGDTATFQLAFDEIDRKIPIPPRLKSELCKNPLAQKNFDLLPPYLRLEIVRYIHKLKTDKTIDANVQKAIDFLLGKGRFVGRNPRATTD